VSSAVQELMGARLARRWRDPAAFIAATDIFLVLVAVSLPWSTSLVSIFAVAALISMAPFFDARAFLQVAKRPVSFLPVAVFAVAVAGTLWSQAPWGARLYGIGPTVKLLMLPLLFYHFAHSRRGVQVLAAFLVSCTALMALSWLVAFDPHLALKSDAEYGVPVKNYIDQSQAFALCAMALAYPAAALLRARRIVPALLVGAVAFGFVTNMAFVVVSRTVLVTIPVMLALFAILHLRWRTNAVIFCVTLVLAGLAFATSPKLRRTVDSFSTDYSQYMEQNAVTSAGLRLEYWRKSLRFMAEAPVLGHGTGSIRQLFEQAAVGQVGAAADVVRNPHNQTLNVALQWGALGVFVLYAMWLSHLLLFRGEGLMAWIGLMVVVQNFLTSLFNSHLTDFTEGWIYVLGVGIAGSAMLRSGQHNPATTLNATDA
jgi:O-antigen ligase